MNCHEQGRFVYRYSGNAIGAFFPKCIRPVIPNVAHALLYDQTHDNQSPFEVNNFLFSKIKFFSLVLHIIYVYFFIYIINTFNIFI